MGLSWMHVIGVDTKGIYYTCSYSRHIQKEKHAITGKFLQWMNLTVASSLDLRPDFEQLSSVPIDCSLLKVCITYNFAYMSCIMRKPVFCICENKGADQLRSNCAADQRLCFHYIDRAMSIPS